MTTAEMPHSNVHDACPACDGQHCRVYATEDQANAAVDFETLEATMTTEPTGRTTPARAGVSAPEETPAAIQRTGPAAATPTHASAPERRTGARSGYPHNDGVAFAFGRVRRGLRKLAMDADPDARVSGVNLALEVTAALHQFASRAEGLTSKARKISEQVDKDMAKLDAQLATLRKRLGK